MVDETESALILEFGKNSEFFKKNKKMLQYSLNGFSRVFILWIIKHYGPIHGYEIMKELDKFFTAPIREGIMKKSTSSKIYPILKKMEDSELILGDWETNEENKQVKIYSITTKGEVLLKMIARNQNVLRKNPQWIAFIEDFHNESQMS